MVEELQLLGRGVHPLAPDLQLVGIQVDDQSIKGETAGFGLVPAQAAENRVDPGQQFFHFKGFDNINDIEIYKNKDILITREDAVPLGPDENFIVDLIGLKVMTDEGEELGTLKDVLQTGANDVYVVEMTDGKELLLPAIKQCILNVDLEQQTMTVHVLDGLMDL